MRYLIATLILSASVAWADSGKRHEPFYQRIAAEALGGEMEVTMPDRSRCDIVTEEYAIEVEWASNWKAGIGQALNYAFRSNKKAGIVLIVDKPTDSMRLMSVLEHYDLPITVWTLESESLTISKL